MIIQGRVKIKLSRFFDGRILNATVTKTAAGKYYVSLCIEEELIPKLNAGGVIAIDVKRVTTAIGDGAIDDGATLGKFLLDDVGPLGIAIVCPVAIVVGLGDIVHAAVIAEELAGIGNQDSTV